MAAGLSFLAGLFAVPSVVFTGGSLIAGTVLSVLSVGAGLFGLRANDRAPRALAIAGLVMGVASLWYVVTGWAVSLDIARAVADLF
jgi:hypothetical protein